MRGVCAIYATATAPGQGVAVAAGTITQRRGALLRSRHQLLDAHHHSSLHQRACALTCACQACAAVSEQSGADSTLHAPLH